MCDEAVSKSSFLFILFFAAAALLPAGCAMTSPPIQINYYDPVAIPPSAIIDRGAVKYISYENDKYEIDACVISGKNIFASNLEIKNKTKKEISPEEYSIALFDGRDRIELQLISKEVVANYRAKAAAGQDIKTGNTILDYSLNSFADLIETAATPLNKSEYNAYINTVIDHYFSFRPIYPGFTRKGIICFFHNFILEYPLILRIKIKEDAHEFKFWPAGMDPVNPDSNFPTYTF